MGEDEATWSFGIGCASRRKLQRNRHPNRGGKHDSPIDSSRYGPGCCPPQLHLLVLTEQARYLIAFMVAMVVAGNSVAASRRGSGGGHLTIFRRSQALRMAEGGGGARHLSVVPCAK